MRPRRFLPVIVVAAALVAAAPAWAQRASLADRVAALEQQAANDRGNTDLVNQLTTLRGEVQALRAQVEELQHQIEQMQQTGKSQYLDLDSRLERLEGGVPAAGATTPAAPVPASAPTDTAPSVHGDAGTLAQAADERGAYDLAFAALREGRYADSARLFQEFLERHPTGAYAPNALYWLGESYYVTQNYQLALQQFQSLLDRYPTHDKAPGALLKVGLSQYGLRQYDAAQATLAEVVDRYPGSDVARTADDRLRAIQLNQVR